MPEVAVRDATPADVPCLYEMIVALAVYEHEPAAVTGTPEMLGEALFGEAPAGEATIAEVDGSVAGFALPAALHFYAKLGAECLTEWKLHRLDGAALTGLAGECTAGG